MTHCGIADESAIALGTATRPALLRAVDRGDVLAHRGCGITRSCHPSAGITR